MVNTRHSVSNSHEDEELKSVNGNCVDIAGRKIDKEEDLPLEVDKSKKSKQSNELFESFNYQRRSMRHQERSLDRVGMSRRSLKHVPALSFSSHGSKIVRRSDRRSKRVFATFNEQDIYRSIEKKNQEMMDRASMYDVIKRRRGESDTQDDEDGSDDEAEDSDGDDEEDEVESQPTYCLRKKKPKTNKYQAPPINSGRSRREILYTGSHSPLKSCRIKRIPQHSTSPHHHHRRSSSTSSSDDEARFERRKSKSMAISRSRCLPMNFKESDLVGVLKDRGRSREGSKLGSSLADVDPMNIDTKTSFDDIGGLDRHIRSLKEMIVFPLLYPEVFAKFGINPPRGVLFYGPPGTGKTLVARALANECSRDGQKVAFFMRKGADCLSKWVGESERQLRLLFDQAYSMRPSIIFFDEIDGIAPVRSTRQDQIHSSIVSTLLALMDGLDARGEIVIIGATNRLDSIDPALRRPGRFDREFLFALPDKCAREKILTIHTADWHPKLSPGFIKELAEKCVGYCGADIKGLCTEAALLALRRRYPQIYKTNKKLVLNTKEIKILSTDFKNAIKRITPTSARSSLVISRALPSEVKPLLGNCVTKILGLLNTIFPDGMRNNAVDSDESGCSESEDIFEHSIYNQCTSNFSASSNNYTFFNKKASYKSRFLVYGYPGNGQSSYICPALLHSMEHLSSYSIDLASITGNSSRTPEEAISQIFLEARKSVPSVIYLPHIDVWFSAISDIACATFLTLLNDTPSDLPILLLSTTELNWCNLPKKIQSIFSKETQTFHVSFPSDTERYDYFKDTFLIHALKKYEKSSKKIVQNEVLLEAPPPSKPRELSAKEAILLQENEEATLRKLRIFLRQVTWKLLADRKFKEFSKPVDLEEVNDYLEVIKEPMDLSTVMTRINSHYYESCAHYLKDIDLIMSNCLEYNPDKDQFDKLMRNRACEMKDYAYELIYDDLDPEFEKLCLEISESRKKRGFVSNGPAFMKVMPQYKRLNNVNNQSLLETIITPDKNFIPDPTGSRFSHRVRGLNDTINVDLNTLNVIEGRKRKLQPKKSFDKESETEAKQLKSSVNGEIKDLTTMIESIGNNDKCLPQLSELKQDSILLLTQLVDGTKYWNVDQLEELFARLKRCIVKHKKEEDRDLVIKSLKEIVDSICIV
ncbi:ATPase family AAA domain-containing protein 2 isoform X3 [Hydra vulgaris]|uniref:ATPase family AAA domain-containing protein 2 isoform X3 n=1 Tax=Hydra vulgaris TaxID=6087 RepID=A0ABM4D8R1_HYDVU